MWVEIQVGWETIWYYRRLGIIFLLNLHFCHHKLARKYICVLNFVTFNFHGQQQSRLLANTYFAATCKKL